MGKNPMNRPYIVGYSDTAASHPHHRAAHGSKTLNMDEPADQVHVLWGALVGGPDETDWHRDITKDYIYNEVAVDYNAAFVGAAAGLYKYYGKAMGNKQMENFPPSELSMKGEIREFFLDAKLEQENSQRTQVTVKLNADSFLPPRYVTDLKIRYFFDISELLENGQTIEDLRVDIYYDENATKSGPVHITKPICWDGGSTYYIEIDWYGYPLYGSREIHFGLVPEMDENFEVHWDPTNDWSRQGITPNYTPANYVTAYTNDGLVWGIEPPNKSVIYGDVNDDGRVSIEDVVKLRLHLLNATKFPVSATGLANAQVKSGTTTISAAHPTIIQDFIVGKILSLPN